MKGSDDSKKTRTVTDTTLRVERDRADAELQERSDALGEAADDLIRRARERARLVLELARQREDLALEANDAVGEVREQITQERLVADDVIATEYADADAAVFDERSARRRALIQMLALERTYTDRAFATERKLADKVVAVHDDMLGSLSHDLRNHISALLVRASVIVLEYQDDPSLVDNARGMQRTLAQMDGLLNGFVDIASMQAGGMLVDKSRVDLASVVADEVEIHRPIADERAIELTVHLPSEPIVLELDPRRISRVVLNLLTNAIKFTDADGKVSVRVERAEDGALVSVTDTGPGIAEDQLEAVFERFRRLDSRMRGYGLGLYIARAIVNAHGGRIWAESKLGEGATFRFRLPVR